jgi:DNA-binding XRE family transcriptional regulator
MAQRRIASHLGTHRRRSGLSQLELARLVGHRNSGRVSRHERGVTLPPLSVALAYEAVFHVPVHELFPGIHEAAIKNIETRITDLDEALGQKSAMDSNSGAIARKLQFIRYDRPARKLMHNQRCTQES